VQFAWEPVNGNGSSTTVQSQAGLYFLVEFPDADAELESQLRIALELLGEEGLGGERSSGAGRFIPTWEALSDDWQAAVNFDQGNRHSLISLFWDKRITPYWLDAQARYALQERGGWIASPSGRQLRRKMVRMFAEGSVFSQVPRGQLADVTPAGFTQHPVYRNGIAFSLPIKLEPVSS
jgi:CRISPR-associated protein Csm4